MNNQKLESAVRLTLGVLALALLCVSSGFGQSTIRNKSIPIVGNVLRETLRNNSGSLSESYYYWVDDSEKVLMTKTITVDGKTGLNWVDTGIEIKAGDTVRLSAEGKVDVGGTWGIHEAEGTVKFAEQPPGYYPVESRTRYGIAARVTSKGSPDQKWAYGDVRAMAVKRSGQLWLTVNDDAPDDNTGEFVVTITVVSRKQ